MLARAIWYPDALNLSTPSALHVYIRSFSIRIVCWNRPWAFSDYDSEMGLKSSRTRRANYHPQYQQRYFSTTNTLVYSKLIKGKLTRFAPGINAS